VRRRKVAKKMLVVAGAAAVAVSALYGGASGQEVAPVGQAAPVPPAHPTFTTVLPSALGLEGLTADGAGNLYTTLRASNAPCPVVRVPSSGGAAAEVGYIPAPCSPSGLAFNNAGRLFVVDADKVWALTPNAQQPPTATVFVSDVPGANGIAFDRRGRAWVSDGTTGQGRVWQVPATGGTATVAFRVQPLANEANLVDGVGGVGRDVRSLPTGTITVNPDSRNAANTASSQPLVANGLAFTADGDTLYVGDTARGAIWAVDIDGKGNVRSPVGCDTTFAPETLCLDDILVQHPYIEGVDGIALDRAGNIWIAANERNAIVTVTAAGKVREFFRNAPDSTTQLRNGGPLEFPTSPSLVGNKLCVAQSNGNRRDNSPSSAGEAGSGGVVAKISCLNQSLTAAGLPLPIG